MRNGQRRRGRPRAPRLVVVGNGMSGSRLVSEVRARDRDIPITVFGAEPRTPYNRVLLSNVVAGASRPEQVRLLGPAWYREHEVTARLGVAVTAIDRETRTVVAADGSREPYDVLVLALGSEPVVPPVAGAGRAIAFRTLDDCERIVRAARMARRAVVVGGGPLGVEAARGLAGRGVPVTLVHRAGHLMERQLDAEAGLVLRRTLAGLGVEVRTGAGVTAIRGAGLRHRGPRHRVELTGGETVEADLVVFACGVRPVTGLARAAGLEVDRGIVVDDEMRTDDPAIHAIGECCQHAGTVYGLVAPAWEQAAVAADLITGADPGARYTGSRTVTRLKAAGVELAAMGETRLTEDDAEVVRFSHHRDGTYRKLVIRDGRLVGAILLGESHAVGTLTQLYDRGAPLPGGRARLLFPGPAGGGAGAGGPVRMPDSAQVCRCNNVTKGRIRACWEAAARVAAAPYRGVTGPEPDRTPGDPVPGDAPGTLVLAAHGTREPAGEAVLAALAARVRAQRPGHRVELAFLEISSPLLADLLDRLARPAVVVPLLLAAGHHARVDLPGVVARARPGTLVARPLGPHPLLTSVLARRLAAAGLRTADAVILGAAGSTDPAARLLSVRLARPVTAAFLSAGTPTVAQAVGLLRRGPAPRVAVASYLLAPGFFQRALESCGADLVGAPLGADGDLAALVWARHDEALAPGGPAPGPAGAAPHRPQRSLSPSRRRR